MKKYYEILGLEPNASLSEIKTARIELLEVWHPDRFEHKPDLARKATEMTKQINNAYDILVKQKENERKPPVEDTKNSSGNSKSESQSERKSHQAGDGFKQKEKVEQERAKNQSYSYWSKVEENLRFQERKRKSKKTILILGSFVILIGLASLGVNWLVNTEWWTDPHYYAPRLTKDWAHIRVPRWHFALVEPIDAGTKIEIRFNGNDKKKEITIKKREIGFVEYITDFRPDNGIIEVRAADAESVGKRYYLKALHNSKRQNF